MLVNFFVNLINLKSIDSSESKHCILFGRMDVVGCRLLPMRRVTSLPGAEIMIVAC
jgi:hypothetical protein